MTPAVVQADGKVFVHRPGKSVPLHTVQDEPVWVSLAEAQAYCKWAGGRVMSEEEYARAAEHAVTSFPDRWACIRWSRTTSLLGFKSAEMLDIVEVGNN